MRLSDGSLHIAVDPGPIQEVVLLVAHQDVLFLMPFIIARVVISARCDIQECDLPIREGPRDPG